MHDPASHAPLRQLSVSDLLGFGDRFGIDYHFPRLCPASSREVLRGSVHEVTFPSALNFTHSCLEVLQPYESLSTRATSFFLLVVLQGRVGLDIAGRHYDLQPGVALVADLGPDSVLHAVHAQQQQLETITLALDTQDAVAPDSLSGLLAGWQEQHGGLPRLWRLPAALSQSLRQLQQLPGMNPLQRRLLTEGLALQLLAHGIGEAGGARAMPLSPGERKRIEAVRRQLDLAPQQDYTVDQLAAQAAMSPSTFRSKFRLWVGTPVFDYLRDRRLALARQYLLQGYSVQQAAHMSGYRHATNFATAFRKHYGTPPRDLC
ncbi:transcriptional regulator [Bordetella ansorpii]|uniref:Transcriptional regulator n=1 Tax=Bordetella ansorpii TaxID=288768 RepID=A0A157SD08_9BORD|nr:AraC family transcriptional regulator [Bordetella ansorpii]SAI68338.1 transcriptional regulator [Bordetella ansorpii]